MLENIPHTNRWEKLNTLTWYPEIKNYTLDVACKLFVGTDGGSKTKLGEYYTTWVSGLFSLPINLPWSTFGRALRCRKLLLAEIEKIIHQRQRQEGTFEDALSLLLQATDEDGESLSVNELKDQILTLLFAGHETLTSAIASFCQLVAQHPQVLKFAREEQQKLGIDTPLTLENLKQMTYLEQVLKEVLRFIPPVGGAFREVIKPCEIQGYQVPQGWSILFEIDKTHQDQSIYQTPEKFDPERFSPEREENKSQAFSYVPFGGGMRECLGKEFARLEIKIFAAILLRQYQWELLPNQNLEMANTVTPRTKDGLKVSFQRLPRIE
ncbi:MAG: cytochrome P450 [Cyanobacteria bacterium J06639_18]